MLHLVMVVISNTNLLPVVNLQESSNGEHDGKQNQLLHVDSGDVLALIPRGD